jgi:CRP/FNR family cyclic AMP-dependent transcriptional regulator
MALEQNEPIVMATDEEWSADLWQTQQQAREVHEELAGVGFFGTLAPEELTQVGSMMHARSFLPYETIVRQGAPGVGMYVILSGSAVVNLETAEGNTIRLATLGEHQFFGEMSLLDGAPRAASVVANERTETLGFFRPDLMGLIEHSPQLGFKIVWQVTQIMAVRLGETLKEFRDVTRTLRILEKNDEGEQGHGA